MENLLLRVSFAVVLAILAVGLNQLLAYLGSAGMDWLQRVSDSPPASKTEPRSRSTDQER